MVWRTGLIEMILPEACSMLATIPDEQGLSRQLQSRCASTLDYRRRPGPASSRSFSAEIPEMTTST